MSSKRLLCVPHSVIAVLLVALAGSACGDAPIGPGAPALLSVEAPASNFSVTAERSGEGAMDPMDFVTSLQLRPAEGSGSRAWGTVIVKVWAGTETGELGHNLQLCQLNPPEPDADRPEPQAGISACVIIHNPGGEVFAEGRVQMLMAPDADPVVLNFELPTSPCLVYQFGGAVSTELPAVQGEPSIQATFISDAGELLSAQPPNPLVPPNPLIGGRAGVSRPASPCAPEAGGTR